jgi:hypothetical protein
MVRMQESKYSSGYGLFEYGEACSQDGSSWYWGGEHPPQIANACCYYCDASDPQSNETAGIELIQLLHEG